MLSIPYEERKDKRIERLKTKAEKLNAQSDRLYTDGKKSLEMIPFGQPILVGHHSEKRDRAFRARSVGKIVKAFALMDEAKHAEERAQAAEENNVISSDDPEALKKLQDKLATLEARRERINKENAEARKAGQDRPYPAYVSSNLSGNILSTKKRIKALENRPQGMEDITTSKGAIIRLDAGLNRYTIAFAGKPDEETRSSLKRSGFRWAPSIGLWVAYVNNRAKWRIAEMVKNNII